MKFSYLKRVSKQLTSRIFKTIFYDYYREKFEQKRLELETSIPKVHLTDKHIKNCSILLNRAALLIKLPHNAIVAEIGVDKGDFSQQIIDMTHPEKLHLVDLWGSKIYNEDKYQAVSTKFMNYINQGKVLIHRKLSLDAVNDFPDNYFDWIYLDTNHAYETISKELNVYHKKIKPGGYITGHDYSLGNFVKGTRNGVIEAVHEFCVNKDWELIYLTIDPIENQSYVIRKIL